MSRALTAVVLSVACLAGCGDRDGGGPVVFSEGDYALPGETLEDCVSYGDQLSVVSVLDATEPEPWPAYKNSGGLAGRQVSVRIERTLWRRAEAPAAGRRLSFDVWGWMWDNDQDPESDLRPVLEEGAPRMQPGRRYLALLVRMRGDWGPISSRAVMTIAPDDRVTSEAPVGRPSPGAAALRGRTLARAAAVVAATRPDPLAARFAALPPRKRFAAVVRERG